MGVFPHIFFDLWMPLDLLIDPIRRQVAALGFELVDLKHSGASQRSFLQVRIDRPDSVPGKGVTAEDCARVSRTLERLLEANGLVGPRYVLQVSSPGFERPIRWPEHWRRYVGQEVRLRARSLPGRRRARILAVPDDGHVRLRLVEGQEVTLALDEIREAHLVVDWQTLGKS